MNIQAGADLLRSGTPQQRANVIGEHRLREGRSRGEQILAWFNRTAFAQPAVGTLGNIGRNALRAPGSKVANLGVFRQFSIREGMRLQFRSEFFNSFNFTNLGNPSAGVNAGARMGVITAADDARVIQLALKCF